MSTELPQATTISRKHSNNLSRGKVERMDWEPETKSSLIQNECSCNMRHDFKFSIRSRGSNASKLLKTKRKHTVFKKVDAMRKNRRPAGGLRSKKSAPKRLKAPLKDRTNRAEVSNKKDDSGPMEVRLLTMVRGKPCARNRMPCDRRKMRRMRLFDPCPEDEKGQARNIKMLLRAKKKVLKELSRQQELGIYSPSPLEQAFLDATNESFLTIDYGWMKKLVRTARFSDPSEQERFMPDVDA